MREFLLGIRKPLFLGIHQFRFLPEASRKTVFAFIYFIFSLFLFNLHRSNLNLAFIQFLLVHNDKKKNIYSLHHILTQNLNSI